MTISTVTLLSNIEHGVPSGNYDGSSQDFTGDARQAANYYRGRGGLQTVQFRVSSFTGEIVIQATQDADPLTARWLDMFVYGDGSSQDGSTNDVYYENILGNFTWLRAQVNAFTTGTIELVAASY